jgi:hypothetical protein
VYEIFCFLKHVSDGAAHEVAAHRWDDAEGAAMIAAFRNLEVSVMTRSEFDALRRDQAGVRVMGLR